MEQWVYSREHMCSGALYTSLYRLQHRFCLLGLFIETALLLSSVVFINNSYVFCILSGLYIFILRVCEHDVWEWKVCSPFLCCRKATKCFSSLRRYCLTVCSEKGFCWDPLACFVPCSFYSENPCRDAYNTHACTDVGIHHQHVHTIPHSAQVHSVGGKRWEVRLEKDASRC